MDDQKVHSIQQFNFLGDYANWLVQRFVSTHELKIAVAQSTVIAVWESWWELYVALLNSLWVSLTSGILDKVMNQQPSCSLRSKHPWVKFWTLNAQCFVPCTTCIHVALNVDDQQAKLTAREPSWTCKVDSHLCCSVLLFLRLTPVSTRSCCKLIWTETVKSQWQRSRSSTGISALFSILLGLLGPTRPTARDLIEADHENQACPRAVPKRRGIVKNKGLALL